MASLPLPASSLHVSLPPPTCRFSCFPAMHCRRTTFPLVRSSSSPSSLYSVLGIEHDVTLSTIKSAYRQLAKVCHPDTCRDSDAQKCVERFLRVQEAYEILSDPERRADYDYRLLHPLLSKGFSSDVAMSPRRTRSSSVRSQTSAAWKLQWEAQLKRLKQRHRAAGVSAAETWSARVRSRNFQGASVC